jgi:tyrosinase
MRYLFLVIAIAAMVYGQYDYGVSRPFLVAPRGVNLETTGAKSPDGSTGIRREIRELEKDVREWNLYLLGLDLMQYMDQSERESWYQIAGTQFRYLQDIC